MKYLAHLTLALTMIAITASSVQAQVIAVVGNEKITLKDFDQKYKDVQAQSFNPPPKSDFLEDLVRFEMGVQEAERKNLRRDPIVQERIKQEIYKALLEKEIGNEVQNIKVTEAEMKKWYSSNPDIRTSHILITVPHRATASQKKEAAERAKIVFGKVKASSLPFDQLVHSFSDDPISKQTGGDLGWRSRNSLFPSYYSAALNLKINEVSGLVESPFGYHIIKVTGRRSYESANKREINQAIFDEKRRQIFNRYFAGLKKKYNIQMNPKLIQ